MASDKAVEAGCHRIAHTIGIGLARALQGRRPEGVRAGRLDLLVRLLPRHPRARLLRHRRPQAGLIKAARRVCASPGLAAQPMAPLPVRARPRPRADDLDRLRPALLAACLRQAADELGPDVLHGRCLHGERERCHRDGVRRQDAVGEGENDLVYPCDAPGHQGPRALLLSDGHVAGPARQRVRLEGDREDLRAGRRGLDRDVLPVVRPRRGRLRRARIPSEVKELCKLAGQWEDECIYGAVRDMTVELRRRTQARALPEGRREAQALLLPGDRHDPRDASRRDGRPPRRVREVSARPTLPGHVSERGCRACRSSARIGLFGRFFPGVDDVAWPTTTERELRGPVGLADHGMTPVGSVHWNPTTALLYTHALQRGDGRLAEGGPLVVDTGRLTGRSPKDKFVVREPGSEERIWWGDVNQPLSEEHFEGLREKVVAQPRRRRTSTSSTPSPAPIPAHRLARARRHRQPLPRAVREDDVHRAHATRSCARSDPQALVLHAPEVEADPEADGTRTGTFVVLHPSRGGDPRRRHLLRAARSRSRSSRVMNDRLPLEGVFPMHCSANVGDDGRRRGLLRPVRHRQDDALRRSRAAR